jgi:carboxymethylenebutenolidase
MKWNSFSTEGPLAITASITTYPAGGGDEVHAYVAQPEGDDSRGGIVLVHHLPGWDEFYQEFAERLARHGYTVICPRLCGRRAGCTTTASSATARLPSRG